jgi:hypothetical protein
MKNITFDEKKIFWRFYYDLQKTNKDNNRKKQQDEVLLVLEIIGPGLFIILIINLFQISYSYFNKEKILFYHYRKLIHAKILEKLCREYMFTLKSIIKFNNGKLDDIALQRVKRDFDSIKDWWDKLYEMTMEYTFDLSIASAFNNKIKKDINEIEKIRDKDISFELDFNILDERKEAI